MRGLGDWNKRHLIREIPLKLSPDVVVIQESNWSLLMDSLLGLCGSPRIRIQSLFLLRGDGDYCDLGY